MKRKKDSRLQLKQQKWLLLMLLPGLAAIILFSYLPLSGWYLAFSEYRLGGSIWGGEWVGVKYFEKILTESSDLLYLLRNTLVMNGVSLVLNITVALFFAIILKEFFWKFGAKAVQTVSFFPYFVSWVIAYSIVSSLLSVNSGAINQVLVLLKNSQVLHAMFISVMRSLIGPVLQLIVTGMAAYALSSPNLIFGKTLRTLFILPMYLSAGIIPNYIFMKAYGLTNNFLVYILPNICSSFNLILIRTYIESVPRSLTEAVYLDGGNDFQAYWKVIFPVCMPVNAAVMLFGVIQQWNALMDTEMYCAMTEKLHTLQYLLFSTLATKTDIETLRTGLSNITSQGLKMAITIITIIPIMCVYPTLQKYFVSRIMVGSVKA